MRVLADAWVWIAFAVVLLATPGSVLGCQAPASDRIYVGDSVVVARESAEFRRDDRSSIALMQGAKLYITDVNGDQLYGFVDVNGQREEGWITRGEVLLDVPSTEPLPPLVLPERPDDRQAVAALKELGVAFELNEKGNVHAADASSSQLTDAGLSHLAGLSQLTALDLSGRPITDAGIRSIAGRKSLKELYLGNTQVTDRGLAMLKDLAYLEILALPKSKVTGAGLVHLKNLRQLMVLNLGECLIGDQDLKQLQQLPVLEVLTIPKTQVTAVGMANLKPLSRLRVLNIIDCAVDDTAMEPFKLLGNLRIVHMRGTRITPESIEAMSDVYPELAFFD